MPIPCGTFIPNFRSGAALGRIGGELMATWFPQGNKMFQKKMPTYNSKNSSTRS